MYTYMVDKNKSLKIIEQPKLREYEYDLLKVNLYDLIIKRHFKETFHPF